MNEGGVKLGRAPEVVPNVLESDPDAFVRGDLKDLGQAFSSRLRRVILCGDIFRDFRGIAVVFCETFEFERFGVELNLNLSGETGGASTRPGTHKIEEAPYAAATRIARIMASTSDL